MTMQKLLNTALVMLFATSLVSLSAVAQQGFGPMDRGADFQAPPEGDEGAPPMGPMGQGREGRGGRNNRRGGRMGQRPGGMMGSGQMLERAIEQLGLDEETLAKVREIVKEHVDAARATSAESRDEMREMFQQMIQARQDGDTEKVQELRQKFQEMRQAGQTQREELETKLAEILTDEQLAKFRELVSRRPRRPINYQQLMTELKKLELTDEQKAKISDIVAKARKESGELENARGRVMQQAAQKILDEVLTDEQRQKIEEAGRQFGGMRMFEGLNLTDEQKAKFQELQETMRTSIQEAQTPEARREAMQAYREQMESILTEEQLQQLRDQMMRRRPGRGNRDGGGRGGQGRGQGPRNGAGPGAGRGFGPAPEDGMAD